MGRFLKSASCLLLLTSLCSWGGTDTLSLWQEFSLSPHKAPFMQWMKDNALSINRKDKNYSPIPVGIPPVHGSAGLFITLIKEGKVRGCFGAFDHSETDPALLLRNYLKGALSYDPRYKPLERYELEETDIVVTIASEPEQVENLNKIDLNGFGVFIECDGDPGRVIVPAEYRTTSRLNINNSCANCRISRFRAVTVREDKR